MAMVDGLTGALDCDLLVNDGCHLGPVATRDSWSFKMVFQHWMDSLHAAAAGKDLPPAGIAGGGGGDCFMSDVVEAATIVKRRSVASLAAHAAIKQEYGANP